MQQNCAARCQHKSNPKYSQALSQFLYLHLHNQVDLFITGGGQDVQNARNLL